MPSELSEVYTHRQFGGRGMKDPAYPKRGKDYDMKTRQPKTPDVMSAYVADFPQVRKAVNRVATGMALVAAAQLAAHHGGAARSANPRIAVQEGDRSDMFVLLVVGPGDGEVRPGEPRNKRDKKALGAAWAVEYGRRGDDEGRGEARGVGALRAALEAVGWG